jgi:signal transduction histidine kinase
VIWAGAALAGTLAVTDLISLWGQTGDSERWAIPSGLLGAAFAVAALAALAWQPPNGSALATFAMATALLSVPLLLAADDPRAGATVVAVAGGLLLPLSVMRLVPVRRARTAQLVLLWSALGCGAGAVAAEAVQATAAVAVLGVLVGCLIFCCGWLQFELTSGDQRRQLLWLVLGFGSSVPFAVLYLVAADNLPGSPTLVMFVASLLGLPLPLGLGFALVAPQDRDVRALISRTVLVIVMLTMTVALFSTVAAVLQETAGQRPSIGVLGVLATVIAAGFHPVLLQARASIDELLFGGRADPVETLSLLSDDLMSGTGPPEWLETLRTTLAVPSLSVERDGAVISSAGPAYTGLTSSLELRAGTVLVGRLVVGLPRDQRVLPPTMRAVLALVAGPLAQALQADSLTEQLQGSRRQAVEELEEERRRVRRDLHDGLGPSLAGVAYSADAVGNLIDTDPVQAAEILRELRADVGEAIAEIRRIVYGLRPKALDELGLLGAIEQRVCRLGTPDGRALAVTTSSPVLPSLPAAVEVVAYRVAVEAVTNVARHAGVAEATLCLLLDGDHLELIVSDQGPGTGSWPEGVGIASMRERVEQIGGELELGGGPEGGRVRARLPLSETPVPDDGP